MPVAKAGSSSDSRVIAHVDLDCFYVQVEQRKRPELRGVPAAVVQYNSWKGGGLIAVSYEARAYGVTRSMRGDEAKAICPNIHLVQVPVARGKADLSTYREAGSEVVSILARRGRCERASIDEVYLDLTDAAEALLAEYPPGQLEKKPIDEEALNSHISGLNSMGDDHNQRVKEWISRGDADRRDKLLACGVLIVTDLRKQVLQDTQFTCSAGIAHNKMLAKLASGMHKPAQQTVVPQSAVKEFLELLPIKKMKQLGGKLGNQLQNELGIRTVGDLSKYTEQKLQEKFGMNNGTWLWNIARGINGEEVESRLLPKSHGSGKRFPGPQSLRIVQSVEHWINKLSEDLCERLNSDLEQNKRIAQTLTLHATAFISNGTDSTKKFPSKSCPLRYGQFKVQEDAMTLFRSGLREYLGFFGVNAFGNKQNEWRITTLSLSASKIVCIPSGTSSILKYFTEDSDITASIKPTEESERDGGSKLTEVKTLIQEQDACVLDDNLGTRALENTGEAAPIQRMPTILRFFSPGDAPFPIKKQGCFKSLHFSGAPSSSGLPQLNQRGDGAIKRSACANSGSRAEKHLRADEWKYDVDEIDHSVIDELPPEIQEEVRDWLHPRSRQVKQRKGIAAYFLPKPS
ncbi:hypothetical protein MLD38_019481 [Melastoma candidum]|uniref:Uncharacterized protein n=1 Tax=Melastoma candidum TaxID=119954 RepID=A0ACB9QX23_9MYRT|nr:hypothetical protein MLD38_019481 [Melastoma candidum]